MKRLFIALIVFAFSLVGCSVFEGKVATVPEKVTTETQEPSKAAKAVEQPSQQVKPKVKKKQEPVVEVIPRKGTNQPELTLEPLPVEKPSVSEAGKMPESETIQEMPSSDEAAKEVSPVGKVPPPAATSSTTEVPAATPPLMTMPKSPAAGVGAQSKEKKFVEQPSAKNVFTITVGTKTPEHPFYGKGHDIGFIVDGVPGKELVLERGKTYKIVVNTNPKHDVYISTKDIGWGSTPWTDGVEGMYTYKGTITFTPNDKTPDVLYYSCRNHPFMGGKIDIVNPGESVEIKRAVKTSPANNVPVKAKAAKVSAAKVNQKLMFADMLLSSKTAKHVADSGIADAISLQKQAEQMMQQARQKLKAGSNSDAFADADQALEMLKKASRMVPSDEELLQLKTHHQELLSSIKDYEKSHADNVKRITKAKGEKTAVDYDKQEVERLKSEGVSLAKAGNYAKANESLEKAQHLITVALQKMLESQTIVYDLKFDTPQEEYEYELKRFGGYEELVPIAIEAKKPTEGAIKLMNNYLEKARKMRDEAQKKADAGDYPIAIRMMLDATKTVRLALRMVGVMQ